MQRCQPSSVPLQQGRHVGFPYEPRKGFVEATMQVQDINIEPPYLPNEGQGEVTAEEEHLSDEAEREGSRNCRSKVKCIRKYQERKLNRNRIPQRVNEKQIPKSVSYSEATVAEKFRKENERKDHSKILFREKRAGGHEDNQDNESELREVPKVLERPASEDDITPDHGDEREITKDR